LLQRPTPVIPRVVEKLLPMKKIGCSFHEQHSKTVEVLHEWMARAALLGLTLECHESVLWAWKLARAWLVTEMGRTE
jgi:hypothetical protein